MQVVHGERLCRAHHPEHAAAWRADCLKRTQAYWTKRRAEKTSAVTGDAAAGREAEERKTVRHTRKGKAGQVVRLA
jgi:hypothetical protein